MPTFTRPTPLQKTSVPSGLVGWWTFDNIARQVGTGIVRAFDASGYGNIGTQQGVGGESVGRGIGRAYDGPNSLATFNPNNSAGFNIGPKQIHYGSTTYSLCCWGYPTRRVGQEQVYMAQTNGTTNPARSILGFDSGASGKMDCRVYINSVQYGGDGATTINTSMWTHLAMTASSAAVKGYVNGVLDVNTGSTALSTTSIDFSLGTSPGFGFQLADGYLDDCRIYNRVLSQAEVRMIYLEAFIPLTDIFPLVNAGGSGGSPGTGLLQPTTNAANMRRQVTWVSY